MPSELVIFVGLPGSGKSTYYRSNLAATHLHISKDLMPNERDRDTKQMRTIAAALDKGGRVVVDNTNASAKVRAPLIALGLSHGARVIAYYFECSVKLCLMRNRGREGKARVPDVAIFVTAKKLQPPQVEEGFDEVRVVGCDEA
jgi:predicted kinase